MEANRSQIAASVAVLDGLANTPVGTRRDRANAKETYADVVFAAPTDARRDAATERLKLALGPLATLEPHEPMTTGRDETGESRATS